MVAGWIVRIQSAFCIDRKLCNLKSILWGELQMVELDQSMLRQLQMTELELLLVVDHICKKNNIMYSLDGGTLLGAIRHQGFIPWDDDADVMMTRAEYDKFYEACKKDLDLEKYFLQEFRTDSEYRWGYSKMRKNGTVFLREGQEHVKCHVGVCIDIFIFDKVPNGYIRRRLHWLSCFIIRKGLYSIVGQKKENNIVYKRLYQLMALLPRSFWVNWLQRLVHRENGKEDELRSHLTYPNRKSIRYGLSYKYYEEYIEKEFEGHQLMVIKDYDRYLRELFDDYMQLPSENKRKIHPVSRIKL